MTGPRGAILAGLALLAVSPPAGAAAAEAQTWKPAVKRAADYADQRRGLVHFAAIDEDGRLRGSGERHTAPSASVIKAMFMVAYLRQGWVEDRDLRGSDKRLLEPMIRESDNATATRVREILGASAIERLARRVGMRDFGLHHTHWGLSRISARDQARFFFDLTGLVPRGHRDYARKLLRTIVDWQRWGVAEATPPGWTTFFKGGWAGGSGRVNHQAAFLELGERRISIAILTEHSPSHDYGSSTLHGVAKRLTRRLRAESP